MKSFAYLIAAISAVLSPASAQNGTVTASLAPAATIVAATVTGAPLLFAGETVQLTDSVLASVTSSIQNESISSLFAFASNFTSSKRSLDGCKFMPGDSLWPVDLVWNIFDDLLGGALIKASPLAAVCYPDWPEYDTAKCATITADWLTSNMQ